MTGADPGAGARSRLVLACALYVVIVGLVGARTIRNLNVPGEPLVQRYGMQDFRDNAYYPVAVWLDGGNPWDARAYRASYPVARPLPAYSPIVLLVSLPFGLLPYGPAQAAYFMATALLYLAIAFLALAGAGARVTAARLFGIGALIALSRPGHQTLYIGQFTAFVVAGTGCALVYGARRPVAGALGLFLTCMKPTYALPLALLMAARREWRALALGLGGAAVLGLLLGLGPMRAAGGPGPLLASVRDGMAVVALDPAFEKATSLIRLDAAGFFGRLMGGSPGAVLELMVAAGVLGLSALVLARTGRSEEPWSRQARDGVVCLAILLSVYHQSYDALLLAFPVTALVAADGMPEAWRRFRPLLLALLLVPAANYAATDTMMHRLAPSPGLRLLIATANGAALLGAFAIWAGLALRREPRGSG
jgi:glycosyl transferase family 87